MSLLVHARDISSGHRYRDCSHWLRQLRLLEVKLYEIRCGEMVSRLHATHWEPDSPETAGKTATEGLVNLPGIAIYSMSANPIFGRHLLVWRGRDRLGR